MGYQPQSRAPLLASPRATYTYHGLLRGPPLFTGGLGLPGPTRFITNARGGVVEEPNYFVTTIRYNPEDVDDAEDNFEPDQDQVFQSDYPEDGLQGQLAD